jgi:Predicted nucleoside-diphosphate sugar epimerases
MASADDLGEYYRIRPDVRDLNYEKYYEEGETSITKSHDYNSHNTERLDVEGMKTLLLKLDFVRKLLKGEESQPVD